MQTQLVEHVSIVSKVRLSETAARRFLTEHCSSLADELREILQGRRSRDALLVQYDYSTQALFFCHWLGLRSLEPMLEELSFKTFQLIANYKDTSGPDYLVCSSSAPNFLTDPLWAAFRFERGSCSAVEPSRVPHTELVAMEALTSKYLYEVASGGIASNSAPAGNVAAPENSDSDKDEESSPDSSQGFLAFLTRGSIHPILVKACLE